MLSHAVLCAVLCCFVCRCDGCKQLVPARKQITIWDDPNILVVHLKRFHDFSGVLLVGFRRDWGRGRVGELSKCAAGVARAAA
jgi:hypothetical protein